MGDLRYPGSTVEPEQQTPIIDDIKQRRQSLAAADRSAQQAVKRRPQRDHRRHGRKQPDQATQIKAPETDGSGAVKFNFKLSRNKKAADKKEYCDPESARNDVIRSEMGNNHKNNRQRTQTIKRWNVLIGRHRTILPRPMSTAGRANVSALIVCTLNGSFADCRHYLFRAIFRYRYHIRCIWETSASAAAKKSGSDVIMKIKANKGPIQQNKHKIVIVGVNDTTKSIVDFLSNTREGTAACDMPKNYHPKSCLVSQCCQISSGVGVKETLSRCPVSQEQVELIGIFDDRESRVDGYIPPELLRGSIDDLLDFARANDISRIIIAIPWTAEQRIFFLLKKLRTIPVRIDICLDPETLDERESGLNVVAGIPIITVANRKLRQQTFLIKRIEDKVISSLSILLLSPLLLLIALAIRIDSPGAVIFRQQRYGFNNTPFTIYKFRTMQDAETPDPNVPQATRNDARVTRIGAFLRRTSLDELPQIFNVFGGSMSIVGPRPHAIPHNQHYGALIEEYYARHNLHPGITGWAQVNGLRGETDTDDKMRRRVEYDLYYIENWSLLFDIQIIVLTALNFWRQKTAY